MFPLCSLHVPPGREHVPNGLKEFSFSFHGSHPVAPTGCPCCCGVADSGELRGVAVHDPPCRGDCSRSTMTGKVPGALGIIKNSGLQGYAVSACTVNNDRGGMAVAPWMTFFGKWKKVFSVNNDRGGNPNWEMRGFGHSSPALPTYGRVVKLTTLETRKNFRLLEDSPLSAHSFRTGVVVGWRFTTS